MALVNIVDSGYGIIPKMLMQDRRLHTTSKVIYAHLASFAGAGAVAFPSREKICSDLNISKDTFGKYLRPLEEFGYVSICQHNEENGRFSRNMYYLEQRIRVETTVSGNTVSENTVYGEIAPNNNNIKNNNKNNILAISENKSADKSEQLFEELWQLYPRRKGKAQVSNKAKKQIAIIGKEQMLRAIERFKNDMAGRNTDYLPYGSTFFNSAYVDYLDANYQEQTTTYSTRDAELDEIYKDRYK